MADALSPSVFIVSQAESVTETEGLKGESEMRHRLGRVVLQNVP